MATTVSRATPAVLEPNDYDLVEAMRWIKYMSVDPLSSTSRNRLENLLRNASGRERRVRQLLWSHIQSELMRRGLAVNEGDIARLRRLLLS